MISEYLHYLASDCVGRTCADTPKNNIVVKRVTVWVLYPDCLDLGLDSHWHLNLENLLHHCAPQLFFSKLGVIIVQNPYEQRLSTCPVNIR